MPTYIVREGDTLYLISKKLDISFNGLKQLNSRIGNTLYPNQRITIPPLALPKGVFDLGSTGFSIRKIQQVLYAIGYNLKIDGIYGNQSKDIIYHIQMKFPQITPDGIYGRETQGILEELHHSGFHIVQDPGNILVLVNKLNGLPHNYVPQNLIVPNIPFTLEGPLPQKLMRSDAAQALTMLITQAKIENITLIAVSAYRSYDRQAEIFKRNYRSSPDIANLLSSRPGESEHQTGLGVDLTGPSVDYRLTQRFGESIEGKWLVKNAPRFGFILRYPKEKENITGYVYEPWHIRFVGKASALTISSKQETLEEFLNR